ncbi:hypothetical protein NHX12_003640 [Muraenolepis orangiensis]|uniref:Zinc finger and BTB domain-containing protein 41 n=1 Tax=Muraenolepis orangiensis TaxID=630683 RepID=A0A9Q0DVK6_9TELE|nr:hypothetical protein NHX12_003640 [Muraenolepis orangiensis]
MKRKPNQPQHSKCASSSRDRALPKATVSESAVTKPRHMSMSQHSLSLLKFLNEDRARQRFCDVSVSVGGQLYNAHKVVLAHGSSYFHAELSKNPSAGHVTLDHVEESVFQHLLGLLYTSECVVAEAELPALREAARFLDMMEVLKLLRAEEGDVGRPQTPEASGVAPEEGTAIQEVREDLPAGTTCSLCGRRLCSAKSLQNHMVRSHGVPRSKEPARVPPGPKEEAVGSGARRSARSRRTPAKYKRDDVMAYPLAEPQEKSTGSPTAAREEEYEEKEVVEEEEEESGGDTVTKKADLKLDSSETPRSFQKDTEEEGGGEREADEEEVGGDGKRQRSSPSAAVKSGSQAPSVYPEGLAPILLQTANKKILKCPKCDKTFDRAGKYESHTRVHTGEKPFQCDVCLQRYSTNSNLTVHKKKHASDAPAQKKEHKCPFCSKLHASRKTLTKHVRRFHPDQVQEFLAMRTKKSDGWKCAVCLKTFTRRPHLEEHMILHSQDRPFKCTFCDQHFKSRFARLKHQEKYHLVGFS